MTALPEAASGDSCLQVFTERYDEFIFGNDTVTAIGPDGDAPRLSQQRLTPQTGESLLAGTVVGAVVVAGLIKIRWPIKFDPGSATATSLVRRGARTAVSNRPR